VGPRLEVVEGKRVEMYRRAAPRPKDQAVEKESPADAADVQADAVVGEPVREPDLNLFTFNAYA